MNAPLLQLKSTTAFLNKKIKKKYKCSTFQVFTVKKTKKTELFYKGNVRDVLNYVQRQIKKEIGVCN